jgi:anti-anti-sigma factor
VDGPRVAEASFSGDLDYTGDDRIAAALAPLANAQLAVVDLREVTFADSSFINQVVVLRNRLARSGKPFAVRLVGARPNLRRSFQLTHLEDIVEFYDSLDAARTEPLA